jgi:hypothetical protein
MTSTLKLYVGHGVEWDRSTSRVVEVNRNGHASVIHALADEIRSFYGNEAWFVTATSRKLDEIKSVHAFTVDLDLGNETGKVEMTDALFREFRESQDLPQLANSIDPRSHGLRLLSVIEKDVSVEDGKCIGAKFAEMAEPVATRFNKNFGYRARAQLKIDHDSVRTLSGFEWIPDDEEDVVRDRAFRLDELPDVVVKERDAVGMVLDRFGGKLVPPIDPSKRIYT